MSLIGRFRASWMRVGAVVLATGVVTGCGALSGPAPAAASTNQMAMIEDDPALAARPDQTLQVLRSLGVSIIRVDLPWSQVAPNPDSRSRPNLNMTDPSNYHWAFYDQLLSKIRQYGIGVDLLVDNPAPLWATAAGAPSAQFAHQWFPSAAEYGQFVQAAAKHYSWVRVWELWDEPNWGPALSPQYNGSSYPVSARTFRSLLGAAWSALRLTGHNHDTIIAGSLSQDGSARVGQTGTTAPLTFVRTLYCIDTRNRPLLGNAAASVGCPTTKAASRKFRGNNPGLFNATGVGVHPYPYHQPPNRAQFPNPNGVEFNEIPNLLSTLDGANKVYGSNKRMLAYNTEYGYQGPNAAGQGGYVSAAQAARYINWAEFLSFKNPRIASYDQFELVDPGPGSFNTGLIYPNGTTLKPAFFAYRMPIWIPTTTTRRGRALQVWGDVRPANNARIYTGKAQFAAIQFAPGGSGSFRTIKSVKITNGRGYFDVNVTFPGSGRVRIAWTYPPVPALASPVDPNARTVYSRITNIALR